jgi:hypothetical protein
MRFLLLSAWPAWGDITLEAGTVLEGGKDGKFFWNGRPVPQPLPLEAQALDADAARLMLQWYPDQRHCLRFTSGLL